MIFKALPGFAARPVHKKAVLPVNRHNSAYHDAADPESCDPGQGADNQADGAERFRENDQQSHQVRNPHVFSEMMHSAGKTAPPEPAEQFLKDSKEDLLLAYRAMDAWLHGRPIPAEVAKSIEDRNLPWMDELSRVPNLRGALKEKRPAAISSDMRIVDSRCRLIKADDPITRSLIQFVRSAREEIFIQSPYLALPTQAVKMLAEASARGVRITVITNSPESSDNPMSQGVFLEQWPELLAQVPTLKLYVASNQHNLHGKVAVIDRQLVLVGTYNLDPLSIALNSELIAVGWSQPLAEAVQGPREAEIAQGENLIQYRIARDSHGKPIRDSKGGVVVKFGAQDHLDLSDYGTTRRYRWLYRYISKIKGTYPWY